MLHDISKWLNIFGVRNIYLKNLKDSSIVSIILSSNNSILITSDRILALKLKDRALFIPLSLSRLKKLVFVFSSLKLFPSLEKPLCTLCGGELKLLKKKDVKGKVPEKVFSNISEFYVCTSCGKIYWKGTHWIRIKKMFYSIKSELSNHHRQ